jgi:23S rRNA pseudouridine1911/1915/1917 synthase
MEEVEVKRVTIVSTKEKVRLDRFLSDTLSITRTKAKEMIEGGYVRVIRGMPKPSMPKPSLMVKMDMEIEAEIPEDSEPTSNIVAQAIPISILYEDEHILAIDKPAGMVVHPSAGHREGTLVNAIISYLKREKEDLPSLYDLWTWRMDSRPGIVHRLDKGTTGVILIAKDVKTKDGISRLFKERMVKKTYRAITEGVIREAEGKIEATIGRHPIHRKKMAVLKEGGRYALTSYRVIERLEGFTYLELSPLTGRTHQIRVHLSHIGHPIVGDEQYGRKARHLADRPLLHASRIEFVHPVSMITVAIEADLPDDMRGFIEVYRIDKRG